MHIRVRVTASARKEVVEQRSKTEYVIKVREPAAGNMANRRVRALLALAFGVPTKNIRLETGHHSPQKVYTIETEA